MPFEQLFLDDLISHQESTLSPRPLPHRLLAHSLESAIDVGVADADAAFQLDNLTKDSLGLKTDSDRGRPLEVASLRLDNELEHPAEEGVLEVMSAEGLDELLEALGLLGEGFGDAAI